MPHENASAPTTTNTVGSLAFVLCSVWKPIWIMLFYFCNLENALYSLSLLLARGTWQAPSRIEYLYFSVWHFWDGMEVPLQTEWKRQTRNINGSIVFDAWLTDFGSSLLRLRTLSIKLRLSCRADRFFLSIDRSASYGCSKIRRANEICIRNAYGVPSNSIFCLRALISGSRSHFRMLIAPKRVCLFFYNSPNAPTQIKQICQWSRLLAPLCWVDTGHASANIANTQRCQWATKN